MTRKHAIIAALVTAASATGLTLGWQALDRAHALPSTAIVGALSASGQADGWRHAGWGHGHRGHGGVCRHADGERLDDLLGFVEGIMAFTPEQTEAWERLAEALRDGNRTFVRLCDDYREQTEPASAVEQFVRLETLMAAGLDLVREVRPAFDGFYATLSETQRQALDDLVARSRHH